MERLGGRNIRITGCPSIFYNLKCPSIKIPELLHTPQRSLGVSIHSDLIGNIFCHSPDAALEKHGQAMAWAIQNSAVTSFFEQGRPIEYEVADRDQNFPERRAAAQEIIGKIRAERLLLPEDLMARMVKIRNVEEWLCKAYDMDAIIGFRFHGNMVALLQGKPCYYYTYDSRLKEFADIYGLPHQDVTEPWKDPVEAMSQHDWKQTNNKIAKMFAELKEFYAENGFNSVLADE